MYRKLNKGDRNRIFGIPIWLFVLAVIIGIVLGSRQKFWGHIDEVSVPLDEPFLSGSPRKVPIAGEETRELPGVQDQFVAKSTPMEPGVQFRAADGLIIEPARLNGNFVGYRVITNFVDPRFVVGDIISAVNEIDVEDSAAGGELLIAALSDPYANVTLYDYNRHRQIGRVSQ